jgi:polyisoprenoid-binding protein YceI
MKLARLLLPQLACAAMLAAAAIPTQEVALEMDPAQTKVGFTLPAALHTVHGSFALKRGSIRFDPVSGKVSGELVVDAASGNSGNGTRDHRMNQSVLESDRYREIVFRPDRVQGKVASQGTSQIEMHGMFAIHGAEHEIAIPLQVDAKDGVYSASGHFTVPYVQWGMKNPSTLFLRVSDKVDIEIQTIAHPAANRASTEHP